MGDEIGGGGGGDDVVGLEVGRFVGAFVVGGLVIGGNVGSHTAVGAIGTTPLSSDDECPIPGGGG